jgi:hypothetical protein
MSVCFLLSVVFCLVEVIAKGLSPVKRSPNECGISECDREPSIMRGRDPLGAVVPWEKKWMGGGNLK